MIMLRYSLVALLFAPLFTQTGTAAPKLPGLAKKHPLTQPEVGRLILGEMRCAACHGLKDIQPLEKAAPNLAEVGARVAPEFLRKFIASPAAAHGGTAMPDLLAAEPTEQRDKIAESITHFLVAQSPRRFQRDKINEQDTGAGKTLFHTIGCVACHSPRDDGGKETTQVGVVGLAHISAKYSLVSLAEFLQDPLRVRPSGRMPDMKLTQLEAKVLASYLLGKVDAPIKPLDPQANLVALGKQHYQRLNCAACHKLGDMASSAPISILSVSNSNGGCLSTKPGKGPLFNLSDDQIKAIRAAITQKATPVPEKTRLATALTAFNCIACHARDDYGGVSAEHNSLFKTSEINLGEEARIPPPLTLVGAKLRPVALKKMLFDGDSVRPYMLTRMPQFGESNLEHLPKLFASLDAVAKVELAIPNVESPNKKEREREKELRAAGREMLGSRAFNCIACHTFNGKASNFKGIDLMISYQRLQPSWFYHYLRDPNAFRPRTIMPSSWPDGKSMLKTVLDGKTDRQIEAIWYYLSLGTSAADPPGIQNVATQIAVTDATHTYRGRSSVAGYRGIAVGFPEKLSYAFNAETGTVSAIWRGDFINVDRGGQGSGAFHPASKFVGLAQDLSFFDLANEQSLWPLRPVMTKEAPVNPDPLYPKNRGYQFKGYQLDDASIPTFLYRSGTIEIEDRSVPADAGKDNRLRRHLTFHSPKEQTLWFRALTGKIEAESKEQFKTGQIRLSISSVHAVLRANSADKNTLELLLRFDIPKGRSTRTVTYELLK
ncbi:MAG: c-type cytochrome [Planctomycetes bacterium]|nr:c-type cytochrome [Planctomycetota bacterium]